MTAAARRQVIMAAVVKGLLPLSDPETERMEFFTKPALTNWNGIHVGTIRPAGALA